MPATDMLRRAFAVSALGLLVMLPPPAMAAWRAITVGVNDYADGHSLRGAVNDATLIGTALARRGIPVSPLLNGAATRSHLVAAFEKLLAESRPGDTILLTLALHGTELPALDPRTEPNDPPGAVYDEVFLFGGVDRNKPERNPDQYLRDDDLARLWTMAREHGVNVVGILDSCHSGTGMRGVASGSDVGASRGGFSLDGPQLPQAPIGAAGPSPEADLPPGVFSYAANTDSNDIREITHQGQWHGALSVAFAEALDGLADDNHDGNLSHTELLRYLSTRVDELSSTRQTMVAQPERNSTETVLPAGRDRPGPSSVERPEITLRINGLSLDAARRAIADIPQVRLAAPDEPATIVWDATGQQGFADTGDQVATGLTADGLHGFVERWQAVIWLRLHPLPNPLAITLNRANAFYRKGEVIGTTLPETERQTLLMINLSNDGTVYMLYPWFDTEKQGYRETDLQIPKFTRSCAPFGAEHLIAAVADTSGDADTAATVMRLKSLNNKRRAWDAFVELIGWAQRHKARMGTQILVTADGPDSEGAKKCKTGAS